MNEDGKSEVSNGRVNNDININKNGLRKRRSIRDIKKDNSQATSSSILGSESNDAVETNKSSSNNSSESMVRNRRSLLKRRGGRSTGKIIWWLSGLIGLLLIGFIGSSLLAKATVTVEPAVISSNSIESISLRSKDSSAVADLQYEIENVVFRDSEIVQSSGIEEVADKASGTITIFNTATNEPQTYVANTRFEESNGNIYRVDESITIPGGNPSDPGMLSDIRVFADEPGEVFNGSVSSRLTIPGLSNDPELFNGVYAEATSDFTGGFIGERPVAATEDADRAEEDLRARLLEQVTTNAATKITGAVQLITLLEDPRFTVVSLEPDNAGNLILSGEMNARVAVISTEELTDFVLADSELDTSFVESSLLNPEVLAANVAYVREENVTSEDLTVEDIESELDIATDVLLVTLEQPLRFDFTFNEESLAEKLAGMKASAIDEFTAANKSINDIEVSIRPFWKRTIPSTTDKIEIIVLDSE